MDDLERDLAVYVLVRTDLPSLTSGKAMAQANHAGVQMLAKHGKRKLVQDYIKLGTDQGANHFNTTIVLGATLNDIHRCNTSAQSIDETSVMFNTVIDPSYPFFVESAEIADLIPKTDQTKVIKLMENGQVLMVREEVTCAWYLGDRNNPEFRSIFDGLNLHP